MFPSDCTFCMATKAGYGFQKKKKKEKNLKDSAGSPVLLLLASANTLQIVLMAAFMDYGICCHSSYGTDLFLSAYIREDYPTF